MIATDRPRLAHLGAALILLTRLPVQRLGWRVPEDAFAGAVWAYPVVGAAVGAVGGIGFLLAESWGFPAGPAAVCALTATILLTGALHEDGLADTADGLGGGATPERRLAIMRDSRIGSYGAIALMLMLAARLSALASMADASSAAAAIVVAGAAGRAAMLILVLLLAPARTDGMATGLRDVV